MKILNDCDINYRQSSNKRLLVELTLIRVAQITQAEEDDAVGAGLSPNRLKSLFKNIFVSQPKPAIQVTGVEKTLRKSNYQKIVNEKTAANTDTEAVVSEPLPTPTSVNTEKKSRPKFENIGVTFAGLQQGSAVSNDFDAIKVDEKQTVKEEKRFTEADLSMQWTLMCNRMPQNFVGLASRLKNLVPQITSYPDFEVAVDNKILLDQISQIRGKIRTTMRLALHNKAIEFNARLTHQDEQRKALTKREIFDELRKRNPAFEKLRVELGLELA